MSFQIKSVIIDGKEYKLSSKASPLRNVISVLTGKNGTGKSSILEFISRQFVISDDFLRQQPYCWDKDFNRLSSSYGDNSINYIVNNNEISAKQVHSGLACAFISKRFFNDRKSVFPKKLICLSTSPFDRFPAQTKKLADNIDESIYTYIGLKSTQRKLSISSLISNVINAIFKKPENLKSNLFIIKRTLNYLGYGQRISVSYTNTISQTDINGIKNSSFIDNVILQKIHECEDSHLKNFEENSDEWYRTIDEITDSIFTIYDKNNQKWKRTFSIPLNLSKDNILEDDYIQAIRTLSLSGLFKVKSFKLSQKNDNRKFIDFTNASSGEQCMALMLLGISSQIEDNSLICIDEPEISLHPEWQEDFIPLLSDAFNDYHGCHFIIATHSPLIISSLSNDNCFVLDLDKNELINSTTSRGRSSDYQLATLFDSPGFKNEYLINESLDILFILSKNIPISDNLLKRIDSISELKGKINTEDPVHSLITTIEKAMEVINHDN